VWLNFFFFFFFFFFLEPGRSLPHQLESTLEHAFSAISVMQVGLSDKACGRAGWNHLGVDGAANLARGLEANFSVTELLLPWTALTDRGCCYIAKALKGNSGVQNADISGNNAGVG
jgi:hypothetical protein